MGLLASHGLTHHLLLLRVACSSRWRCRRLECFSSSTITMAATPHRMLKWASCHSNSCLLNTVTTAEVTGEARWPTFIPARIFGRGGVNIWRWLCDHLQVAARSPNGDPAAIYRFVNINRRLGGALPGIGRSPGDGRRRDPGKLSVCSLVRPITMWVPDSDRQETADPVLTAVQGHENWPAICRCRKIGIRQKSAKNLAVTTRFIKFVTSR